MKYFVYKKNRKSKYVKTDNGYEWLYYTEDTLLNVCDTEEEAITCCTTTNERGFIYYVKGIINK
jgi:hypothetical protein